MSNLQLNVSDGFSFDFKVGVPYFKYSQSRKGLLIAEAIRFIATGGCPPYAYNLSGNINSQKIELKNFGGYTGQYDSFADLRLTNDVLFTKEDIGVFPITVTCLDSCGTQCSVTGSVNIADGNNPYSLSYKLYTDSPSIFKHVAYFKTGLFGLTISPRGFFVFQDSDKFSLYLRIAGEAYGNVSVTHSKKPTWVSVNQPSNRDMLWTFTGTVEADTTYDKIFEWEISIKDKVSDSIVTTYPSIPIFLVVRGK